MRFSCTALPGDYYLRLPVIHPLGVLRALRDELVMVDGCDPADFPELEEREPEEPWEGLFPMVVRTVIAVPPERLTGWLAPLAHWPSEPAGLARPATDEDIAGVLYWGSENERWRLRRICIGRYSRFEELDDTSELDSYGAFRDWLLVQGNQYQAWSLYPWGWSDYNTTDASRILPFLQQWLMVQADVLQLLEPAVPSIAPMLDERAWALALAHPGWRQEWQWQREAGVLMPGERMTVRG